MRLSERRITRLIAPAALLLVVLASACSDGDAPTVVTPPGTGGSDPSGPSQVTDATLGYDGDAVLAWTAPSDDDGVASYDIRYSYSFPLLWDVSLRVDDPPAPATPGESQSYRILDPLRGRDLYAAIRSVDEEGHLSKISSVAHARIPGYVVELDCRNAISGAPVAGLDVTVTARHVHAHVTDTQGRAVQDDLTAGVVNVAVRPGASGIPYHYINDPFELDGNRTIHYAMIPYQPTERGVFDSVLHLFMAAANLTSQHSVFKKWHRIPVPVYMPEYVNDNGVDYAQAGRQAAEHWEQRTGIDLWEFVDNPPDTGVVFVYRTKAEMGVQLGYTVHINGPDGYPVANEVNIVDNYGTQGPLLKTMLHEFGHTIRLYHLPSGYLMYAGQPLPDDVTDDEVLAVQLYTAMPNGIDIGVYDESVPAEAP
jgi:hypothetical protein